MGYFLAGLVLMVHLMSSAWCAFSMFGSHSWMSHKINSLMESGELIDMQDKKRIYIIALYYVI